MVDSLAILFTCSHYTTDCTDAVSYAVSLSLCTINTTTSLQELAKGQMLGGADGFLKLIFHTATLKLLGVHAIGDGATEIIHIGQVSARVHTVYSFSFTSMHILIHTCSTSSLDMLCPKWCLCGTSSNDRACSRTQTESQ
jgi:Pyridine nucleotide-disulphide oxidoreductase, dimerisation domain